MIANQKISEIQRRGYCVLRSQFPRDAVEACRDAFWPLLLTYLSSHGHEPNRGAHRHFLPMHFTPPCFAAEFFFNTEVLDVVCGVMGGK